MPVFNYQARSVSGRITQGKLDARDEADARIKLRSKQLLPVKITMQAAATDGNDLEKLIKGFFETRIKSKDLQLFTRQFATLINAGIQIADALRILYDGATNPLLKESLLQIRSSIDTGKRLSDSMMQHPRVFDRLYCNMIQAGEEAGMIDTILLRLASYIEKNEKIKNQVKGALVMPAVITVVAFCVITGIIVFVIPKFQGFYSNSGKALPFLTQSLVDLSDLLRKHWLLLIIAVTGSITSFIYYINTPEGKKQIDTFMINAPLFGDIIQKSSVARMSRTLSTLLSSGIGLIEAIDIASRTAGNYVIEKALASCRESVMVGKPFNVPLSKQKEIPQMVSQMVAVGEQSGAIDTMLAKVADFYEDEVENAVKALTSLIEPLMMVILGGIIAVVLIAMYLPIFGLGDTMG
ncbi:MAG: type II secretion system F family protein [Bdellovibrionaceae bacterium]|nr:type II secretion system F family protein [Bdellovibrio sp.]